MNKREIMGKEKIENTENTENTEKETVDTANPDVEAEQDLEAEADLDAEQIRETGQDAEAEPDWNADEDAEEEPDREADEDAEEEPDREADEDAEEEPDREADEDAEAEPDREADEDAEADRTEESEVSGEAVPAEDAEPEPDPEPVHQGKHQGKLLEDGGKDQPEDAEVMEVIEGRKAGNRRIAFLVSMLVVIGILAGIYVYGYNYCALHFMPGTKINGYDCGGLTEEEVEKKFSDAANDYVLNVRFRGGSTEIIHARDMGFEYKPDGSIAALLQQQDKLVWPKYFFEDSLYEIKPGGTYDDDMLTAALQKLPELQEDNMEKPKDAYIEFESGNEEEDGKFVIRPETAGTTLDIVQLAAGVGDAAARYSEVVEAEKIGGAYVEASMKSDNAKIIARCNDLNDLVGASITYKLPDGSTMRLNSDVTKDWLVKDDSGKLVKDEKVWDEKLWEFLDRLAYNTNTIGMDRQFNSTLRGLITVSGGDYGYMVNQVTEHDKLVKDFKKQKKETREPDYYITPYNDQTENDGIGNTYIEADLSAQHIWCYVDGQLVVEGDCVSGDTTTGHGTPTGVFGIMFMLRDTTLRGVMQSNGKYEYETKVGYWMPFYDGCGFHDAWWRSAFGGTIYQGNGSHGCINLPVDVAEQLYSYCDDKMPVVVYW